MKVRKGMDTPSRRALSLAVATVLLTAGSAYGEPLFQAPLYRGTDMSRYSDNFVEIGGAYSTDDSYKFGQWTGMTDKGGYVLGNFNYSNRGLGDKRDYFWANGYNLGFDSRTASLGYASQGLFSLYGSYQGLPFYASDSSKFIFDGLGGTNLTARTSITTANPWQAPNANNINNALVPFNLDTQRDVWRLGGKFLFGGDWEAYANYRQDNIDGNKLQYGSMFATGGNPRSNALPVPVSETTYQLEAGLRWNGANAQAQLNYWYSKYSPDNNSVIWQNPFQTIAGWPAGSGFPNSYGQLGLDPGNSFNQISATGAWNFAPSWRLNSTLQYSWARQDESFLPYYAPIGFAPNAGAIRNPSTSSLDGKVDRWLFNVGVNGRALPGLTVRAKYTFDDNSNKTASNFYRMAPGGLQQGAAPGFANTPYGSYTINRFSVEGDYQLLARTLLRGSYTYVHTSYEDEEREKTYDNIASVELRQTASNYFTGFLKYTYWNRSGSDFDFATGVPPVTPFFINNFVQNRIRAQGDIGVSDAVNVTLAADFSRRRYNDPSSGLGCASWPGASPDGSGCIGLQDASWTTLTADLQWRATEALSAFAFVSYGDLSNDQLGRQVNQGLTNQNALWTASLAQKSNTFGVGANYNVTGRFDVGANWIYNQGRSDTGLTWGTQLAGLTPTPVQLPASTYNLQSFQLFGKYQFSKNIVFRANWWYQKLDAKDYVYDNVTAWSSDRTVFAGQTTPNYSTNVFGLSVAYTGF